jgi:peptidyl-dipeptidase A
MNFSSLGLISLLCLVAVCAIGGSATAADESPETRAKRFVAHHETTVRPLEIEVGRCWWAANISGSDADYRKKEAAELRLNLLLADPKTFSELKAVKDSTGKLSDPVLQRQIEVLYLQYLGNQLDPDLLKAIVAKANAVEKAFNNYRPKVDGKELTDNDVRQILRTSKDSKQRQAAWEASKGVGSVVEADLKALVKLRNESARKLGYKDYHVMQLALAEQSQEQVLKLFDELDALTRGPFREAKAEIDAALAKNCGIKVSELRPWHYHDPFCQESPDVFGGDSEALFAKVDIQKVCREFYAGIGLPIDDVLKRSDLYAKKGKSPHAFCTDIDREGDVRVLANIVADKMWLSTMLHELGHAVYSSKNMPQSLPYVLRSESHCLTTEGVAMMFERFCDSAEWLEAMGVKVPAPKQFNAAAAKVRRNRLLIFSRWCQVMLRFEKELYANPDQNLNDLWWTLVEKYQEVKRPGGRNAPDFGSKLHICSAPVYYHNYQLGELFAAQLHGAIVRDVLKRNDPATAVYVGNKAVGEFMRERVFFPGRGLDWNRLTRFATGEDLTPQAFAAELRQK